MCKMQLVLIFMLATVAHISAVTVCDQTIINSIVNSTTCPKDVLKHFQNMSPMTYAVIDEGSPQTGIRCVKYIGTEGDNNTATANATIYFKDTSVEPKVVDIKHELISCMHSTETYNDNVTNHMYTVSLDSAHCFYRCSDHPDANVPTAACAVSISRRNDPDVLAAVEAGKAKLAAVGVKENLVKVESCTE